jgi:hypothetical protein
MRKPLSVLFATFAIAAIAAPAAVAGPPSNQGTSTASHQTCTHGAVDKGGNPFSAQCIC